ncbi:MAG: hypothetical protein A3E82_00950 [Gammaproteobacteria bacterium RIFCSPHIGHO2_12_FULL_38_11]|nr:MAG: hypothetical protein A3E82_00950 [Gammaproteobacteria bacterium RIFCSPHIGHO2_12_FULL_38_11]
MTNKKRWPLFLFGLFGFATLLELSATALADNGKQEACYDKQVLYNGTTYTCKYHTTVYCNKHGGCNLVTYMGNETFEPTMTEESCKPLCWPLMQKYGAKK